MAITKRQEQYENEPITVLFIFEKETPGTYRFQEVDEHGNAKVTIGGW
jgi:hypothetical protein